MDHVTWRYTCLKCFEYNREVLLQQAGDFLQRLAATASVVLAEALAMLSQGGQRCRSLGGLVAVHRAKMASLWAGCGLSIYLLFFLFYFLFYLFMYYLFLFI